MNRRQQRLADEKIQVDRLKAKLDKFIADERPNSTRPRWATHFTLLVQQPYVMGLYSAILQSRIDDLEAPE